MFYNIKSNLRDHHYAGVYFVPGFAVIIKQMLRVNGLG